NGVETLDAAAAAHETHADYDGPGAARGGGAVRGVRGATVRASSPANEQTHSGDRHPGVRASQACPGGSRGAWAAPRLERRDGRQRLRATGVPNERGTECSTESRQARYAIHL